MVSHHLLFGSTLPPPKTSNFHPQRQPTLEQPTPSAKRVWCTTGDDPHLFQLETEEGRILPEWQSLNQLCLIPETRFICARQAANNATYAPRIPG